jgi:hypothetical protein
MKVLFLTLVNIDDIECQGIYTDLLRKFRNNGHEVIIVCPSERKFREKTKYFTKDGVQILKVWTTNIQKTNVVEKVISTLIIESLFLKAINKYFKEEKFDFILYSTPPITFTRLIN